ncbi:MAG: hypoxanthine phosphoribosyltransferase [Magnetococcales bacterium]|nr:hypoxanthine phosphoribosyltransferase [Magnetococcales bacterium]
MTLMLDAGRIREAVVEMARRIDREVIDPSPPGEEPVLVVVLKGAFVFGSDLLRALSRPIPVVFVHARSQDSRVVMTVEDQQFIRNRHVILVDILMDSGGSLKRLHRWLMGECRPASIRVAALLHKTVNDPDPLPLDFLGYEVPDVRLVGYGMDENQRYRGLPEVYTWWTPSQSLA